MTLQVTNKPSRYAAGFMLDSILNNTGLVWMKAAAVNIVKGQALIDDGSGYATNTGTAFAATFLGVAMADANNSAGSAGDISVPVILPLPNHLFWVQNESATVAAQTDIGETVDLESNDGIDVTDVTLAVNWGFQIIDIDISTKAVAAVTGGFVYGRFVQAVGQTT